MTTSRRLPALAATIALACAACGGSEDATSDTTSDTTSPVNAAPATTTPAATTAPPATTTPPTTDAPPTTNARPAPPTTEPVEVPVEVISAENGFIEMMVAPGWVVGNVLPEPQRTFEDQQGLAWVPSSDSLVELAALSSPDGHVQFGVLREGRYLLAPEVLEWDQELGALFGVQPNIDVPIEWGGGRGESTRGRLGQFWVRHDSVQVGDHLIGVLAVSDVRPDDEINADVDFMIDSIRIDPSALPPLTHALDTTVTTQSDATGTAFSISILVPPSWIEPEEATDIVWVGPTDAQTGVVPTIAHITYYSDQPIADFLDDGLAERGDYGDDTVVEDLGDVGGAFAVVAWDGPPDQATQATLAVGDGVVSHLIFIVVPRDPATLREMIASILINQSALLP